MRFEVGVRGAFRATHALHGDFGPARDPHAHDYRIDVAVQGDRLRADGTLCDIVVLRDTLASATRELDGARLDALAAFRERNSTAEEVARHVAAAIGSALPKDGLRRLVVRVWESPDAYASCEHELP
ncbi:MAG TPA: 6-carboxytetrahydropterin synthase [Candidatus Dormibacteraeota bacterium]|nr:6-carboxytetrahydropterin synthase [Candidatus Dormibacteraeota bacterium]